MPSIRDAQSEDEQFVRAVRYVCGTMTRCERDEFERDARGGDQQLVATLAFVESALDALWDVIPDSPSCEQTRCRVLTRVRAMWLSSHN